MATTLVPLADPTDLAAELGVPEDDPAMLRILRRVSARFRSDVGHQVTLVEDDTALLDGDGTRSLLLPAAPVTVITSVTLDGQALAAGTDYEINRRNGILRRAGCQLWPDRLECVQVVYSHGYADVPEDVADAVLDECVLAYGAEIGLSGMTVGGEQLQFASGGTSETWSKLIERYGIGRGDEA